MISPDSQTAPMTKSRSIPRFLAAFSLAFSFCTPAAADLYATGGGIGEPSGLWTVNPLNGHSILVWNLPGIQLGNGGLAYDAETDTLYATGSEISSSGTSRLFAIDLATGAITPFPAMNPFINLISGGLAIHPLTGVMYATGGYNDGVSAYQSTGLFTIDKQTGQATLIGFAGGNCCTGDFGLQLNGLGFRADGTLFANGWGLGGPSYPDPTVSHLFTVDLASGAATNIGANAVNLGRSLKYSGLAFAQDGTLLSIGSLDAASGALFSVDPATGAASPRATAGLPYGGGPIHYGVDGGLVFVPEPRFGAMLAAGAIGIVSLRRKKDS